MWNQAYVYIYEKHIHKSSHIIFAVEIYMRVERSVRAKSKASYAEFVRVEFTCVARINRVVYDLIIAVCVLGGSDQA